MSLRKYGIANDTVEALTTTILKMPWTFNTATKRGYTYTEIYAYYLHLYPSNPFNLTAEDVLNILVLGLKTGVFLKQGCATGANSDSNVVCRRVPSTGDFSIIHQKFYINPQMTGANPMNSAYIPLVQRRLLANANNPPCGVCVSLTSHNASISNLLMNNNLSSGGLTTHNCTFNSVGALSSTTVCGL